ncbi:MAG: transcription termination/antitermination protein NusG [Candidatus Cloacimonetes bacterium]|nr:transcription termination/antitermination protein NusG [Candidatus Cloacimonadota bacterium]
MKWYVIHTFASQEFKIKELIEKSVQDTEMEDKIGQILIPTQTTYQIRDGKKVEREKKIFNSYIILQADLTSEVYTFIRNIQGVTNFLGSGTKAHALDEHEVNRLLGISDRDKTDVAGYEYLPGDIVKITAGPFTDFSGVVKSVDQEAKKLSVEVTVFGRVTPVEVAADQVEINK